ncbi:cysteine desulfurase-like protein [Photobacterium galatheae]|uniref:Cysteine desulfurase n=1 Tax=Photobacterium galatheae TaxID=1654360 RepID=A0A066RQP1_9GAMM|nr:cysteine desulfurase-like protein [Photobacterium galatheae]KDM89678.1 cysteine desulfurase [Photobacterium galatheae]MCM0151569.1 cysteine desulfurase-like protein [Photobacterium galatheae]
MHFEVAKVRQQFPALNQQVNGEPVYFFDGPGGSQVPSTVLQAMTDYLGRYNSNLGGAFFSSEVTVSLMASARQAAQALLNASSPDNIIFGANMTSLTFQLSRAISRDWQQGDEVIVTSLDHYSNVSSWQQAADDKGVLVHQVRVHEDDCTLDYAHFESLLSEKTRLVAVTYASNTTGSLVDVARIVEAAHRVGAKVYVDAVHYAPHKLVDVQALGCDFLACSAYKFFGPHVGIAYVAPQWLQTLKPYKVEPATDIGPGRFETGTQNFEGLAGVIAAIDYLAQWGAPEQSLRQRLESSYAQYQRHEEALSEHFLNWVKKFSNITMYGIEDETRLAERTPTFAIRVEDVPPSDIASRLGQQNMCVWNGHFYALGLCRQLGILESGGVIRIGFMHYNTQEEIDQLFDALSPFLKTK